MDGTAHNPPPSGSTSPIALETFPVPPETYKAKFDALREEIAKGNTYLANLTQPTPVRTDASLLDAYRAADARFKLYFKDQFAVFSPERFVKMEGDTISTYPMKGTIDASVPDAEARILADPKEMAEHVMIVDLLRNDLSIVAEQVRVEKFRYVEKIAAGERELLQVSSHIAGNLPEEWRDRIGDILLPLLPAGSVTGTPKKKTVELLEAIEGYDRGFFTGVFGYFDGKTLDSAVAIRFLEKTEKGLVYKSGGGITWESDWDREYREMIAKVYVPQRREQKA